MIKELKAAFVMLLLLTLLTGVAYPLVVTGIAQAVMPARANGSLIMRDGKAVGSVLIGQPFSSPKYFWSRPSATSPYPYNAAASSGSNQGPTNPAFTDAVAARVKALRDADPDNQAPVPVDLVTASGRPRSGIQPGGCALSDQTRGQGPRIGGVQSTRSGCAAHASASTRLPGRATSQRTAAQSRTR